MSPAFRQAWNQTVNGRASSHMQASPSLRISCAAEGLRLITECFYRDTQKLDCSISKLRMLICVEFPRTSVVKVYEVKVYEVITSVRLPRVRDDSCGGGHLDRSRVSVPLCGFRWFQFHMALIYVWCGTEVLESEPVGWHIKVHVIKEGGEKSVTGATSICFSLKWLDHLFGEVSWTPPNTK